MSTADKMKHTADQMTGKVKEGAGKLTGDEGLADEGTTDQIKADAKQASDAVQDAVHDASKHAHDTGTRLRERH